MDHRMIYFMPHFGLSIMVLALLDYLGNRFRIKWLYNHCFVTYDL